MNSAMVDDREEEGPHQAHSWRSKIGKRRNCNCGLFAPMWTAWTLENPGRRFIGCPNYKVEGQNCGFFEWCDPEFPERAKQVILHLRGKCLKQQHESSLKVEENRADSTSESVNDAGGSMVDVVFKNTRLNERNRLLKQSVRSYRAREKGYIWAIMGILVVQVLFMTWSGKVTKFSPPFYLK